MKGKQNLLKGKPKKGGTRTGYGEQKKPVNLSLTPTAIAALDAAADKEGISRSELIELYGRNYQLIEAVLDAVEGVLYNAASTEECLPPHPSHEVDGDAIRRLSGAFMALMAAEEKRQGKRGVKHKGAIA